MKKAILTIALAIPLIAVLPARAQGGCDTSGTGPCPCDDSPENPTLILAGLAGGVFAVSSLRTRLRARRAPKQK